MKSWLKWSLGLIVIIGIMGGGFAWWVYNKPHRNINNEVAVKVPVNTLLDAFKQNEKTGKMDDINVKDLTADQITKLKENTDKP